MDVTFEIVLPVFGLVLCGYAVGRTKILTPEGVRGLTGFVFYVAIPVMMFRTVTRNELPDVADLTILFSYFGGCYLLYFFAFVFGRLVFKLPTDELAIFAMGSIFGNSVMLGLPLVYAIYGEAGMLPLLILISFNGVQMIGLTALIIEIARGNGRSKLGVLGASIKALAGNPALIAIFLALPLAIFDLDLPKPVDRFAELMSGAAAPCALFALGASLVQYRIAGKLDESLTIVAFKLIVHPALVWVLSTYVFELQPMWAAIATITAALPTGANVFIYSSGYGIYVARATSATLISTGLSVLTMAVVLAWVVG